jgi:ubiquinone/menaquinone biosynthesis C-methylase UbiE
MAGLSFDDGTGRIIVAAYCTSPTEWCYVCFNDMSETHRRWEADMNSEEKKGAARNFAERYEATLVPVIFQPWAKELISRAAPKDGDNILDLACGTGAVTQEVVNSGISPGSLTGVDMSSDMLSVASDKAKATGYEADWIEADAAHLPFPDNQFDIAFCQQALQFFPDRTSALIELRRVLAPGGRIAFCVSQELSRNPLLQSQALTLEKHAGPEAGNAVRAICSLTDENEIRRHFEDAGFGDIELESVSLSLHHLDGRVFAAGAMGGMHTGDKMSQLSESQRDQCINDFLDGLGDCFDGTAMQFPHVSHVITARA